MTGKLRIPIRRLPSAQGLPLPDYETPGAAGLDLIAALNPDDQVVLDPGGRALLPTGLVMALPGGFEAQVRPRSGLALKRGITVLNSPGTIDSDYRGEIKVILVNHGLVPHVIRRGDKIAQLVVAQIEQVTLQQTDRVDETARGTGGFGSTSG